MKRKYMYPSIRFRPRKSGKFVIQKIYCYIRLNGAIATPFSTSIECIYKFDAKKQVFTGAKAEVNALNEQLTNIRTEIRNVYNKIYAFGGAVTPQMLRDQYLEEKRLDTIKIPTALQCFNTFIEYRRHTEDLEETTLSKVLYSMNHFKEFLLYHFNRKDIELRAITANVATGFFKYLQKQKNNKGELLSYEHCFRTLQHLIKCLDFAVKKHYLLSNALLKIDIKNKVQQPKIIPLSESEIIKLMGTDGCSDTEKKVLDGFIIMCYTGFRHSDYKRFLTNPRQFIFQDNTGFEYIELLSYKNRKDEYQESSYIPFHPIVKNILLKYDYKLPIYSDQVINRYMKQIAPRAGVFHEKITTYTARKSCACMYGNWDGIDTKTVAKMLGHKKVSTTEKYYFRVNKETVKRQYLKAMAK